MKAIEGKTVSLFQICSVFFRIGLFTFGGGYAMIPLIEIEVVEKQGWFTRENITDIIAIAQCGPGAIAINSATYIGYQLAGIPGALAAALGVVLPSFIVIVGVALAFTQMQHNLYIQRAFQGLRPAVVALVFSAALRFGKQSLVDRQSTLLGVTALLLYLLLPIHPALLLLGGGLVGYLTWVIGGKKGERCQ